MKIQERLLTSAALVMMTLSIANCSSAPKHEAAAPPPPTPQQQAVQQLSSDKERYLQDTQRRIDDMAKFETSMRNRSAQVQAPQSKKLSNAADDLDVLLKEARTHMDEVRSASAENWIDYRRDVDNSMNRAESQYSNAVSLMQ